MTSVAQQGSACATIPFVLPFPCKKTKQRMEVEVEGEARSRGTSGDVDERATQQSVIASDFHPATLLISQNPKLAGIFHSAIAQNYFLVDRRLPDTLHRFYNV
uniref:Uncharacterized protein n=1 Tax=Pristionchus pacificus TaxID=54126 RepID=A0A2A6CY29_PRIPA|eukprot:PDM83038.1 hypothetical protein PRIPAC_37431 [Pristionchus pacificus]